MMWMPMPGQSWPGVAATFLGMWMVMMAAMMLPTLTPRLWRYREFVRTTAENRLTWLVVLVAAGYFCVWALTGLLVFIAGAGFAALEMQSNAVAQAAPVLAGGVVLAGGALQLTKWKAHRLACCRELPACSCHAVATFAAAWRHGLRIGLQCSYCCAGFTAILLAVGVMDLRAMAVVTVAISLERLMPAGERMARLAGVVAFAVGLTMIVGHGSTVAY
jgi:predicted metal-binding membrane protein